MIDTTGWAPTYVEYLGLDENEDPIYGGSLPWTCIENDDLVLGVMLAWGGVIGYLAAKSGGGNLVDNRDPGREIQQSWYGTALPGENLNTNWSWNPVQGGSGTGILGEVLAWSNDGTTIYVKTRAALWLNSKVDNDGYMEQWITLSGPVVKARYKYTYNGATRPYEVCELPACWMRPDLSKVVAYLGASPWTGGSVTEWANYIGATEGWNHTFNPTEKWVALVDGNNWGFGLYTPPTPLINADRWGGFIQGGSSYVAPTSLTLADYTPGSTYEYDSYYTIGTVEEIRARFSVLDPPTVNPKSGIFHQAQTVTITDPRNRTIIYTLDGSDPRSYIPTAGGKATFDGSGVLILTDEPSAP